MMRGRQTALRGLGLTIALLFAFRAAGADLQITAIETLPGGRLRLTFEDTGLGILNYLPASRLDLAAGSPPALDPTRRIVTRAPGVFETIVPDPGGPAGFYQIAGFPPPDADADGLSDALEILIGTSTNSFDTDGDGFGDAHEIVNNSDPLVRASVPDIIRADFVSPQSSAREGEGTILVPVRLSRNFTGRVRYSVAAMSTAATGSDFAALPGWIEVNGTQAMIPIVLVDDFSIEDVKLLILDLENDPDFAYQTGGASRHSILLHDNDSYWSGVLRHEDTEQAFRMRILRQGGAVEGALVSSFDTNNTAAMRGVGSIPPGVWNLAAATLTPNTFTAVSVPIPMGESTLFGGSALSRLVSFSATPGTGTNYLFKPNLILGTYLDRLSPAAAGLEYLNSQRTGVFVLMEELPLLPIPDLPAPASPAVPALANRQEAEANR